MFTLIFLELEGHTHIVPTEDILSCEEILNEKHRWDEISWTMRDPVHKVEWLAKRQLIKNEYICPCGNGNAIISKKRKNIDGIRWRCKKCKRAKSIRYESFISGGHLSIEQIIKSAYMWSKEYSLADITDDCDFSGKTGTDWLNFMRDIACDWVQKHAPMIGGFTEDLEPIIVEIDESAFGKPKYHVGHHGDTRWVFGGIQRHTKLCFAQVVEDRSAEILLPIIQKWISPGSCIMSDGWSSYQHIDQIESGIYSHDVVFHNQNFVNPKNPDIHTQSIESMWSRLKKKLKNQHGTSSELFGSYVDEFVWRSASKSPCMFSHLIHSVVQKYSL